MGDIASLSKFVGPCISGVQLHASAFQSQLIHCLRGLRHIAASSTGIRLFRYYDPLRMGCIPAHGSGVQLHAHVLLVCFVLSSLLTSMELFAVSMTL